ncbi:MAG: hypothetical protein HQL97_01460 [Magnetococcales bacterium]|nr:hypothetical protein [Magnetococcales bacterium]
MIRPPGHGRLDRQSESLRERLSNSMSARVAFAFMVFTLFHAPCQATIAAIRREAGSWGWAGLFSARFSLSIPWSLAYVVIWVGRLVS